MSLIKKLIQEHLKKINEANNGNFSFNTLTSISTFSKRIDYCKQTLGNPIGNGSSRMVFQISDERVLKIAKNKKGIAQNEVEGDYGKQQYDIFPKLFNVDDDYIFLETEYVLPCKKEDFPQALGITFEEYKDFIFCCYNSYARNGKELHTRMSNERYIELLDNNENLSAINTYLADYQLETIGDLLYLRNLGLTMRDGELRIVILDDGLSDEVYNSYYK